MRTKRINNKLSFKKETVAKLNNLTSLKGGATVGCTIHSCCTCNYTCNCPTECTCHTYCDYPDGCKGINGFVNTKMLNFKTTIINTGAMMITMHHCR